mmetsp:Transcript_2377/g.4488  ORF Transcript_2377/g.4488 Transcript_2377/m.4488 type:complete len:255 (-) Transcript_2377:1130-1894(-)
MHSVRQAAWIGVGIRISMARSKLEWRRRRITSIMAGHRAPPVTRIGPSGRATGMGCWSTPGRGCLGPFWEPMGRLRRCPTMAPPRALTNMDMLLPRRLDYQWSPGLTSIHGSGTYSPRPIPPTQPRLVLALALALAQAGILLTVAALTAPSALLCLLFRSQTRSLVRALYSPAPLSPTLRPLLASPAPPPPSWSLEQVGFCSPAAPLCQYLVLAYHLQIQCNSSWSRAAPWQSQPCSKSWPLPSCSCWTRQLQH